MRLAVVLIAVAAAAAVLAPAASAAARDRTPPSTPTNVRVVAVTEDTITIAWNASTDNSGKIHAYIAGGIYHPGNSTTKTFTGLVPSWTQTYRVQAMDPSGNVSGLSAPVTATTAARPHRADHADQSAAHWDDDLDRLARVGPLVGPLVVQLRGADRRAGRRLGAASLHRHAVDHAAHDPAGHAHLLGPRARLRGQRVRAEQRGHRDARGERGRDTADRTVEPDGRGPQRQLRQPGAPLDRVDGQRRPAVGDRVRALPQRPVLGPHTAGHDVLVPSTRRRVPAPGSWSPSTARATARPRATRSP